MNQKINYHMLQCLQEYLDSYDQKNSWLNSGSVLGGPLWRNLEVEYLLPHCFLGAEQILVKDPKLCVKDAQRIPRRVIPILGGEWEASYPKDILYPINIIKALNNDKKGSISWVYSFWLRADMQIGG